MAQTRVVKINEAQKGVKGDWVLCLQWCRYEFEDGTEQHGYRFIWRRPNGTLQAARGQARIPSIPDILELIAEAIKGGWGHRWGRYTGSDDYVEED